MKPAGVGFMKLWCVLQDNRFVYYSQQPNSDSSPKGEISLDSCTVEVAPEPKYNQPFCFELTSPAEGSTIHVFVSENGTSMQDW